MGRECASAGTESRTTMAEDRPWRPASMPAALWRPAPTQDGACQQALAPTPPSHATTSVGGESQSAQRWYHLSPASSGLRHCPPYQASSHPAVLASHSGTGDRSAACDKKWVR